MHASKREEVHIDLMQRYKDIVHTSSDIFISFRETQGQTPHCYLFTRGEIHIDLVQRCKDTMNVVFLSLLLERDPHEDRVVLQGE